ncbi:MAG: RNA methyltransferase [Pseudazoarcus pumilus]|nr:RNA methyltransferase [Pseudazoarcus pumilus]
MKHISSRDNPLIKQLRALSESARERRETGQTVLDGVHLAEAALAAGVSLQQLVVSERGMTRAEIIALLDACEGTPSCLVPDALFAQLSPVDSPTGLLAVIDTPEDSVAPLSDTVIALDGVQDPGNLGTILRTAAAAGVRDVLLGNGCVQAWAPRVLRAGMGGHFRLRLRERVDLVTALKGFPGQVLATLPEASTPSLYQCDLSGPVAWLFGAEGAGLSSEVAALATGGVRIPMPGAVESLNVGAAVAVCLFEQARQRAARP